MEKIQSLNINLKEVIRLNLKPNYAELGRIYNCDWRTVKNNYNKIVKKEASTEINKKKVRESKLDEYKEIINSKLEIPGITIAAIYAYLKNEKNYTGSYGLVKKYANTIKKNRPKKATIRVTHEAGKSGQVDWKEDFKLLNKKGEIINFNIFLFILPYSGKKYFKLTLDRKQDTVINCLIGAFRYVEGIPKDVWFDNMSTIVDIAKMRQQDRINNKIVQFAHDVGFNPIPCRAKRPQSKRFSRSYCKTFRKVISIWYRIWRGRGIRTNNYKV